MPTWVSYLSKTPPTVNLGANDYTGLLSVLPGLRSWWSLYSDFAELDDNLNVVSIAPRAGAGNLIRPTGSVGPMMEMQGPLEGARFQGDVIGDHLVSDYTLPGNNWGAAFIVYENGLNVGNNRTIGGVGLDTGLSYARRSGGRWATRVSSDTVTLLGNGFRLVMFEQIGDVVRLQARSKSAVGNLLSGTYSSGVTRNPACRLYVGNAGTATGDWMSGIMEVLLFEGSLLNRPEAVEAINVYAKGVYFDAE